MNPRRFLFLGGAVLVTIGVAGVFGVLGRLSRRSFFHPPRWINWFHLGLGSSLLGVAFRGGRRLQSALTLVGTISGLTLGSLGLLLGPAAARRFKVPELADPSDHTAHLAVGLLALWGWAGRESGEGT
jgi:hypothetical protein